VKVKVVAGYRECSTDRPKAAHDEDGCRPTQSRCIKNIPEHCHPRAEHQGTSELLAQLAVHTLRRQKPSKSVNITFPSSVISLLDPLSWIINVGFLFMTATNRLSDSSGVAFLSALARDPTTDLCPYEVAALSTCSTTCPLNVVDEWFGGNPEHLLRCRGLGGGGGCFKPVNDLA